MKDYLESWTKRRLRHSAWNETACWNASRRKNNQPLANYSQHCRIGDRVRVASDLNLSNCPKLSTTGSNGEHFSISTSLSSLTLLCGCRKRWRCAKYPT